MFRLESQIHLYRNLGTGIRGISSTWTDLDTVDDFGLFHRAVSITITATHSQHFATFAPHTFTRTPRRATLFTLYQNKVAVVSPSNFLALWCFRTLTPQHSNTSLCCCFHAPRNLHARFLSNNTIDSLRGKVFVLPTGKETMAPLPRTSSLQLFPTFNNSDEEDSLTDNAGGIALFTMETNNNNHDFGGQALLFTGETAEHVPGTRKRSDSSASDSSDDSEKTVVPSSMISNCGVVSTLSDSAVALLSSNMPASEEAAHVEPGTKKRSSSVSTHSSNTSSVESDRTVMPNRINGNGGDPRFGYTVEAHDVTPEYHLPTEIEYPVHEGQNGYLDDTSHFLTLSGGHRVEYPSHKGQNDYLGGMGHSRTSSGEHRVEYPVQEGENSYLGHSRSSSRASSFEAGLRSLSLSNSARDANDSLKCKSHHNIFKHSKTTLTNRISQDLSPPTASRGHQRNISRNSSYPSIPSPLGPQTFTSDLLSDVSGLVPSVSSTTPRPHGARQVSQPEAKRHRQPTSMSPLSPSSPLKILKPTVPNPHHRRQNTDPFVDQERTSAEVPKLAYNQPSPTSTPRLLSPGIGYGIGSRQTEPISTPLFADPGPYYAQTAVPSQRPSTALTEQQKRALRQTWIEDGAREIAALARARATADAQYQSSRSLTDLQVLHEATAALAEATSLERRVEQRRNLFMPVGMQAMRTTAENRLHDGFGGAEMGGGEGRLLGGQMAVMERICGEVLRGAEERRRRRGGA